MNEIVVPRHLRERQALASDPARSVWVAANAGSGKTHVLTQRVIRLLLAGVPPAKLLSLTFTKAAAAEMSARVFKTLSGWTMLDDRALRAAIVETGAPPPSPKDLVLARRLFTRTIETPGGLKIQTIHAFCERLLHLFPFEANVPARFEVADELRAAELLSRAREAAIARADRETGALKASLRLVADLAPASGIDALVTLALRMRAPARRHPEDLQETLAARLGVAPDSEAADIRRAMIEDGIGPNRWAAMADALDSGSTNDCKQAARLRAALAAYAREASTDLRIETLDAYLPVFFDAKGTPRSSLMTKALAARCPDLAEDLAAEGRRLLELRSRLRASDAVERTRALLDLVGEAERGYARAKTAAGLLDFDDLVERTLALLAHSDAGWVLHKLDAGIDHVLVDEAQDTSEAQWKILERLTGDFASGHGAASQARSFFVVGDDKQSIFSFQGAAPLMFGEMRGAFEQRFKAGRKPFERVSLTTSFRSVPTILAAVDQVFELAAHRDGLVPTADVWPAHESVKATLPGLIEIWPCIGATEEADPEDWTIPLDVPSERNPCNIVADRVARQVKRLIAPHANEWVHRRDGTRRAIDAGDILILVRTRNAFFEAVIRALKRHFVPVAGADRLDVANHIAVMDLVAAGRVALLPQDDLSLAALLKSPLFGFDDADLMALAPGRRGPLVAALAASPDPRHRDAHARLAVWSARAPGAHPFAFYVELLGRDGGRRLIESRLGPEAHDAIDEFLRLALSHEQQGAPSLHTFLDEIEALDRSIRRDMEGAGAAVRVMTVHAAKGLEAKIVFLPDTCQVPDPRLDPTIFDLNKGTDAAPILVWSPHKAEDPEAVATARAAERQAAMREYRRLLYVGLTRAEERLYIAGFYNSREPPNDCWNAMIEAAFPTAETVAAFWDPRESVRRVVGRGDGVSAPIPSTPPDQREMPLAPEWLGRPVDAAPRTATLHATQRVRDAAPQRRRRLAFGTGLHVLLQHLPGVPTEARVARARAVLAQHEGTVPADLHEAVVAQALAVLAEPGFAPLFGPGARAEVPLAGVIQGPDGTARRVDGVVDRLVVESCRVIVADFKTGAPNAVDQARYGAQLGLYRDLLRPLWPHLPIEAWLIWTQGPRLVVMSPEERAA